MIKPSDLVDTCLTKGFIAACITDHGNLRAAPIQWEECKGKIKCILGIEAYLTTGSRHDKDTQQPKSCHLILLAKNKKGWQNLLKLSTLSFLEGFYYSPRLDWELLNSDLGNDLIVLSACMRGEINFTSAIVDDDKNILGWDSNKMQTAVEKYLARFGDDFFIELQATAWSGQAALNEQLVDMAVKTGIPLVATTDAHFLTQDSYKAHQAMVSLRRGTNLKEIEAKGTELYGSWFYLQTPEEMEQFLPSNYAYEALNNTGIIASMIEEFDIGLNPGKPFLVEWVDDGPGN
ncbi:MAG: PHP domain-containing protein [Candidatus Omnitrophica bacterium]|nr:PHP domain-containing protein [Candidatus Omnitrophota bacterium]